MKDYEYDYFTLRTFLYTREKEQTVLFKLSELMPLWHCTDKNVKRKLKKYQRDDRIYYTPGNGRGHSSTINFLKPFEFELRYTVGECEKQGDYEGIFQLLQLNIPRNWFSSASNTLNSLLGIQTENGEFEILRSIISRPLSTIDPIYTSIAMESFLIHQFGDTLVSFDEKTKSIKPHIAHHWQTNSDYTSWTFYLRKGVLFHHNKILTSKDVRYTFIRAKKLKGNYYWKLEDIVDIQCPSPYIVIFNLRKCNPFFIRFLCHGSSVILPQDIPFDEYKWIGTGPFKMQERTDEKLVLEANNQYFLERPLLDKIEFLMAKDQSYPPFNMEVIGTEKVEYHEKNDALVGLTFLSFNFRRNKIIQHLSFRKALYHLLDIQRMYQDLGREKPYSASSFFSRKSVVIKKNPNNIRSLLKEANYRGEELHLLCSKKPRTVEEAEWFIKEANHYGINIKLKTANYSKEIYTDFLEQNIDLMMNGEVPSPDEELSFLDAFYNKTLVFQRFLAKQDIAFIEEKLKQISSSDSFENRDKLIDQVELYLRINHLVIFLQHPVKQNLYHSIIQGFVHDSYGYVDLKKLWIMEQLL